MPYFEILRPSNILILFFGTVLGAFVSIGTDAFSDIKVYFAAIATMLIGGAGNVINDVFDEQIDRINKPMRPIPRGAMTSQKALQYWLILNSIAIVISIWLSFWNALMAILTIPILYAYSRFFKGVMVVGNVIISILVSLGFLFGAAVVGSFREALYPTVFSFLLNLGREILKDMEDIQGDKAFGIVTFPIKFGTSPSLWLVTIIFFLFMVSTIFPFFRGEYGTYYLITVLFGTILPVVVVVWQSWRNPKKENLYRQNTILKVAMAFGIVAVALGKV